MTNPKSRKGWYQGYYPGAWMRNKGTWGADITKRKRRMADKKEVTQRQQFRYYGEPESPQDDNEKLN